jgi:hypothetical protein
MTDNAFYYRVAYAVTLVLYAGYAISLLVRGRALARRRARQREGGA